MQLGTIPFVLNEFAPLVGARVRELRLAASLSQEALAAQADLHRNYVGSIERGERDVGVDALNRLSGALGVSLAEFFQPFQRKRR